jgi:hypothetical protein
MAQQQINVGAAPNDGQGDPIRTAYIKCNNNFDELYSREQPSAPTSAIGSIGDVAGMYSYSSTFFYICTADYDGSTQIWRRVSVAAW